MELEFDSVSAINLYTMTSQQILQSDLLDILFEKRNKEYGAYALRRGYRNEMIKALVITVPAIFLLLFLLTNSSSSNNVTSNEGEVIVSTAVIPKDLPKPEDPKQQQKHVPQVKQQTFITPKIVDKEPVKPVATQTQLINAQVSDITLDGPNVLPGIQPAPFVTDGGGDGKEVKEPTPKKELAPDRQPQFPGGSQAWLAFLNTHLRPPQDLEAGEKRIVNIRFFVDVDGAITNFQVARSGGNVFDNEVIRVLKKMPKWVPAMQGGQPMAVAFTQPVTFVGQEE
jgi:protein TonB